MKKLLLIASLFLLTSCSDLCIGTHVDYPEYYPIYIHQPSYYVHSHYHVVHPPVVHPRPNVDPMNNHRPPMSNGFRQNGGRPQGRNTTGRR